MVTDRGMTAGRCRAGAVRRAASVGLMVMACAGPFVALTWARQAQSAGPPMVGKTAPDFTLTAVDGTPVRLAAALAKGPVVLIVGRGWVGYQCPFCNRQFGDFLRHAPEIEAAGARVLWVYPGPAEQVRERANEFAANRAFPPNFAFLLDPGYAFTLSYGLRWDAPNETAYPSTFVIDRAGVVRFAHVSRTHGDRAPATSVLAALAALKK
jgi:thioredoxin-dependent peroxiredoxin